jgi:hypothetical protein
MRCLVSLMTIGFLLLSGCQSTGEPATASTLTDRVVPVKVTSRSLTEDTTCQDSFVTHNLPYANGVRVRDLRTYISNGSGLAAGDLDKDGDLDLVFASIDRPSTILWNEGGLEFTPEEIDDPLTRGAAAVDVDGDGWLDLLFTHTTQNKVSYWRNLGDTTGESHFTRVDLPGVDHYAYAMAWADLVGDPALDLVTGSYDTDLEGQGASASELEQRSGIVVYEQVDGIMLPQVLTKEAENLALALVDLNADGLQDIWAANDFLVQDMIWEQQTDSGKWLAVKPFERTSYSTMSIDWGDLNNDGRDELITTDMNPYDISVNNMAAWLPVFSSLQQQHERGDPQIMANTLQFQNKRGEWQNRAAINGMDATGWSWSGRFGDLDSDGLLDLYIVNGMIASNLFGHLPNAELIEENQAFHNRGEGDFVPAPEWGLASTASGRGMLMADMDGDGDLDIVVNNLRHSAQIFENQLCGGENLLADLRWQDSANTHAIGAKLALHTDKEVMYRDIRTSSGYLTSDAPQAHFGFPSQANLVKLVVIWPDGAVSEIHDLAPQTHLEILR